MRPGDLIGYLVCIDRRIGEIVEASSQAKKALNNGDRKIREAGVPRRYAERSVCDLGLILQYASVPHKADQAFVQEIRREGRGQPEQAYVIGELRIQREAGRAARAATAKGILLWVTGIEVALTQVVLIGHLVVGIHQNLIFSEPSGNAEGGESKGRTGSCSLRRGNQVAPIGVFEVKHCQRHWTDV